MNNVDYHLSDCGQNYKIFFIIYLRSYKIKLIKIIFHLQNIPLSIFSNFRYA